MLISEEEFQQTGRPEQLNMVIYEELQGINYNSPATANHKDYVRKFSMLGSLCDNKSASRKQILEFDGIESIQDNQERESC